MSVDHRVDVRAQRARVRGAMPRSEERRERERRPRARRSRGHAVHWRRSVQGLRSHVRARRAQMPTQLVLQVSSSLLLYSI